MSTTQTHTRPDAATAPDTGASTRKASPAVGQGLPGATTRRSGAASRIYHLARAELKVLGRNSVAAFYAVAMAPGMVYLMTILPVWEDIAPAAGSAMSVRILGMLAVFGIVMAIYFNLTTAAVARRESYALKRQISGTARPWEVLTALAAPNVAVFGAQMVVVLAVIGWRMEMPPMTNLLVAILGLALGAVVFALAAYVTSTLTRTAEAAQLTTMPMMLIGFVVSGVLIPMEVLPGAVRTVFELLPVMPVTELVTMGLGGTTLAGAELTLTETFSHSLRPLAVLAAWSVLLAVYVSRKMVFEPRR